jgi:D-sedoheptulose 7-phosphate isomerase
MTDTRRIIREQLDEALAAHSELAQDQKVWASLSELASTCADGLGNKGIIFFAGNGGSFADAQHMAAELTGKMGRMRRSLSGVALGANSSSMSAIGNDFGYQHSFARELEGLHRDNSVVVAFSTSGNSTNLIQLAKTAKTLGLPMVCFTGESGGEIAQYCDVIRLPSRRTERIQEMQTLLGHTLCLCIEELMGLSKEPYGV